jgi:lipopolysaccharide/colanic/teichoic acid biosynthesis glycosyltransferase
MAHRVFHRTSTLPVHLSIPDQFVDNVIRTFSEIAWEGSLCRNQSAAKSGSSITLSAPAPMAPATGKLPRLLFDVFCSVIGLAILAPLFVVTAVAIKLDDGGPVFYSHVRIGKGLRKFRLYKFRSMIAGTPNGSPVTAPQDSRVTRVGGFLRRFKLDELPQLVNVLIGDMQLVGARPQLEKFVEIFHDEYRELLQSRPGITDLASLIFRNEAKFFYQGSIEEQYVKRIMPIKLEMSLKYSRTRTFLSDLEIIFRTVLGLPCPPRAWDNTRFDPAVHSIHEIISRKTSSAVREILQ